jgi:hypothetical protein
MTALLIRDLDARTHAELKRRAEEGGVSVQAYVSRLLDQHTARPSLADWLQRLDELPRHPDVSGAELVRAGRDEAE